MNKNKNIIIISMLFTILFMAIGFSSLVTQLDLDGTSTIVGIWDVKITGVNILYVSDGCDAGKPQFTDTSVSFDAKLIKPGDYITYFITIENRGTFNAVLKNATFTSDDDPSSIIYSTTGPEPSIDAGGFSFCMVMAKFDENATEVPEVKTKKISGFIEYVQE